MSEIRTELADAARKALSHGQAGDGLARDEAAALPGEMGWLMAHVPEDRGGLGLGHEGLAAIAKELGRALVPGPVVAQVGVIAALSHADAFDGRDALLEAAMGGEVMTTSLAVAPTGAMVTCVPDADRASHVLVLRPDRVALVARDAPGVTVIERPTWDRTRRLFDVVVPHDAPAKVLAEGTAAQALDATARSTMLFALAADALGGAEAALAMTVDYLKTRRQFDRPLAMFQALKHRVADLQCAIAAADALLWQRAGDADATLLAMGALKAHACGVYRMVTEEMIQLHGGIGLTAEYACHLFLKRALLNAALLGDGDHWDQLSGRALLEGTRA
ncbi:acyl-CoA dehydrogenase family protein [Novosphingobium sp.]|uniref:acyl-CoA dehydrogenase family protein n=1 Tax=Novosphingobium sp. TaxID=1874826 RepID=UPI0025D9931D|nr:acyl-CoA dehydrogenase family protein [Novosphingobium sp.]